MTSAIPRPEIEVLLCCARTVMTGATIARLGVALGARLDWPGLLRLARRHGMLPLLAWHLDRVCPDAVPPEVLADLRARFRANAQRNLFLLGELERLVAACRTEGLPAIPFKGPALALAAYGNLALRQFCDLDLLVHRRHVRRVSTLLGEHGYRRETQLSDAQRARSFASRCAEQFVRQDGRVVVDLHWDLTPRHFSFALSPERLWERVERVPAGDGHALDSFAAEDLLLFFCVHGTKHCWDRLEWISAVAELIRARKDLDWAGVMAAADSSGASRMLALGLSLARDLLGAGLPEAVEERMRADGGVRPLVARVHDRLLTTPEQSPGRLEHSVFHLRARERMRDRVRYCLDLALTPTVGDWNSFPLPPALAFLHYPLRPLRLIGKYGFTRAAPWR